MDYIDLVSGKREYGELGVPQGGVEELSPILSNIYLHELDKFMKKMKEEEEDKGILRPVEEVVDNPKSKNKELHTKISNMWQTYKTTRYKDRDKAAQIEELESIKTLEKKRAELLCPSKNTNYDTYQLWYVRYADNFVIGIRGSRKKTQEIYDKVKIFLENALLLEMSVEKTLITNIKKNRAKFLGAEIRSLVSRTFDNKKTKRSYKGTKRAPSGKIILLAPIEKIIKKLQDQGICKMKNFANRQIIPQRKTA